MTETIDFILAISKRYMIILYDFRKINIGKKAVISFPPIFV